jgi:chaperonin cofactor prefoldin
MTTLVSTAARVVAELRERLKAEFGLEDGEQALEDTLEGATELPEMLAALVRQAVDCEDQSEAIGTRVKTMQARAARLETKAQSLRVSIAWALQEAGMKRIPADALPEMTVSLSAGRAPLVIPNDGEVPVEFCRIKSEPNKTAIREAIERSGAQSWAFFGNARPTLKVRAT